MKKRGLSFILLLFIIGMPIGYSSNVLFSKVDIPRVDNFISPKENSEGVTRYVYGFDLVASVKSGEINYYHSDRIGSNRLVSDSSGDIEKEFKSLPFGQEIKNEGVRYAFATGKELDESDLHYFGARYYDSNLGKFISVDPVQNNHAYSYVANNPLMFVDPDGREITVKDFYGGYTKDEVLLAALMFSETFINTALDLEIELVGSVLLNRARQGIMGGTGSDVEKAIQRGYGSLGKVHMNLFTGDYDADDTVSWSVPANNGERVKPKISEYKSYLETRHGADFETLYLTLARSLLNKYNAKESVNPTGFEGIVGQGGTIDVYGMNYVMGESDVMEGVDSHWEEVRTSQRYVLVGDNSRSATAFVWGTKDGMPAWTELYWNEAVNGVPPMLKTSADVQGYIDRVVVE